MNSHITVLPIQSKLRLVLVAAYFALLVLNCHQKMRLLVPDFVLDTLRVALASEKIELMTSSPYSHLPFQYHAQPFATPLANPPPRYRRRDRVLALQ